MYYHLKTVFVELCIITLLCSCKNQRNNETESIEIAEKDTVEIVQNVLFHKQLDSLLNFAFKGQTLKIVKNNIIRQPLALIMNEKAVEFTDVDSSSYTLRVWNRPRFFAKITVLQISPSEARLVVFFESIGLFGEYSLKKSYNGKWEIVNAHFSHT